MSEVETVSKKVDNEILHVTFSEALCGRLATEIVVLKGVKGKDDVCCLPLMLNVGRLDGDFWDDRLEVLHNNYDYIIDDADYEASKSTIKQSKVHFKKLLDAVDARKTIVIWQNDGDEDFCGLEFVVSKVLGKGCQVIQMKLNDNLFFQDDNSYEGDSINWVNIIASKVCDNMPKARELSKDELEQYSKEWKSILEKDSVLRVEKNGHIECVSEDYYDHLIVEHIPDEEFRLFSVVFKLLSSSNLNLRDTFLADRVMSLVEKGELVYVSYIPGGLMDGDCILRKPGSQPNLNFEKIAKAFVKDVDICSLLDDEIQLDDSALESGYLVGKDAVLDYLEKQYFINRDKYSIKKGYEPVGDYKKYVYGVFRNGEEKPEIVILVFNNERGLVDRIIFD